MSLDFTAHVRSESARFLDVMAGAEPSARVPSCPDWDAADLLWHLTEVQAFWGEIVARRAQSPEVPKPDRPGSYPELLASFSHWSGFLAAALEEAGDTTPVWTWADDHSVGFVKRRQAHEALIHRLDAELVAGSVTPLPAPLAADGVLEALDVMYGLSGGCPPWGTFAPEGAAVRVRCTDTGHAFDLSLGRFTGTDPDDGEEYDELVTLVGAASDEVRATVSGTADDLDAWLWHRRGADAIELDGDQATLARLRSILARPVD